MNYEITFYQQLKAALTKEIPELKHIRIFNNQFERQNEENSWGYPCAFIQFNPTGHNPFLRGIQEVEYTITIHIGLESYLDEDLRIYELKQKVYKVVNYFECNNWTRLVRSGERPDFNHDDYQVYEMDFLTVLTDYSDDDRPKTPAIVLPVLNVEIKKT